MFFLAILLYILTFSILFFSGSWLGRKSSIQICIFNSLISYTILILYLVSSVSKNDIYIFSLGNFINIDLLLINWSLFIDRYTLVMSFVVTTISFIVFAYSIEYMSKDINKIKFFAYLNLFTFFMLVFITAGNFIQMFLGWEGIGICSYLLIVFWDTRISAVKSAVKAVVINKVGDLAFILTICLIFLITGSVSTLFVNILTVLVTPYIAIINISPELYINLINLLALTILLSLIGKSAQVGLHIWLPDAMEGPTPVSALLHAATMVTAGVFLSLRLSVIFELSTVTYWYALFGGITALYAAILGFCQEDLKKSIAYSTCSQLGYMVLICSLGGYNLSFFHLFNHAFFKALLFLTAGCIIHNSIEEQDMRVLGGFSLRSPLLFISMFVGGSALLALPFLSGFYSKELIINSGFLYASIDSTVCFFFCITAAVFTVLYTSINTFDLFFNDLYYKSLLKTLHPTSLLMSILLTSLILLSFWSGFLFSELFLGIGNDSIVYFKPLTPLSLIDLESLGFYIKYLPTITSLILAIYSLSISDIWYIKCSNFFFKYLSLDEAYFKVFSTTLWRSFSKNVYYLDRGVLESIGPQGFYQYLGKMSLFITSIYNYSLVNYLSAAISFSWVLGTCLFLYY